MSEINVRRIGRNEARVPIIGTAPVIVHRFDEKARETMLAGFQGRKTPKSPKDPEAEFNRARWRVDDHRDGFPASGFKAALVGGARYFQDKKLSMTLLKQAIFVNGVGLDMLVPFEAGPPKMREDYVRLSQSTTSLVYRPMYEPWAAELSILYVPSLMNLESVVALVDAGGLGGIGEWRPSSRNSSTGVYGTFTVDDSREVKELRG
ncbi:MAG: hypothetical protein J2P57_04885 [Acidimicrobiaceae bacterium]|nr:hypothetical protein [Acidimicrobiaceae bacterium]